MTFAIGGVNLNGIAFCVTHIHSHTYHSVNLRYVQERTVGIPNWQFERTEWNFINCSSIKFFTWSARHVGIKMDVSFSRTFLLRALLALSVYFQFFAWAERSIVRLFVWDCLTRAWTTNAYGKWYWFECHTALHLLAKGERKFWVFLLFFIINIKCHFLRFTRFKNQHRNMRIDGVCRCDFSLLLSKNVTWIDFFLLRFSPERTCFGKLASPLFFVVINRFNQIATVKCYSVSHWTY